MQHSTRIKKFDVVAMFSVAAIVAIMVLIALIGAGCANVKPVDANRWAESYYNQDPTFVSFEMVGTNMTITGVDKLTSRTYRPPISIIPKEPGAFSSIMDTLKTAATWFFGWKAIDSLAGKRDVYSSTSSDKTVIDTSDSVTKTTIR